MWAACTDLSAEQRGPAVELMLSGIARDLCREIPLAMKVHGANFDAGDGRGPQPRSGIEVILLTLHQHFPTWTMRNPTASSMSSMRFGGMPTSPWMPIWHGSQF